MPLHRIVVLILTLAVLTGAIASPRAADAAQPAAGASAEVFDREAFRKVLVESAGPFMRLVMETFPAEYAAFETEVMDGLADGTLDADGARQKAFDFTSGLRERIYEGWDRAPDGPLVDLVGARIDTAGDLKRLKPSACVAFLEGTATADDAKGLGSEGVASLGRSNMAMAEAAKQGRKANIKRRAPDDREYQTLAETYIDSGGDVRWLTGLGTGDFAGLTTEDRCDNGIRWLESIRAQPAPSAARILVAP